MRKQYNIIDVRTAKALYSGLSRKEVHEAIGIKIHLVSEYAEENRLFEGTYRIAAMEPEAEIEAFKREWREITGTLLTYKGLDRIKIKVSENGG